MKKILYVVLHGVVNKNRYDNVMSTWGKNKDLIFYSDYEDIDKNIIKVSENSDYFSNEIKHVNIFKFLHDNPKNYEWFFFCDDDTFVNTEKLESELGTYNKDGINGCCTMKTYPKMPDLVYCSGGAGYLIHKNLVEKIGSSIEDKNTGFADVTLGMFSRENKIPIYDYQGFNTQNNIFHGVKNEDLKNHITFHYIKDLQSMEHLYNNTY